LPAEASLGCMRKKLLHSMALALGILVAALVTISPMQLPEVNYTKQSIPTPQQTGSATPHAAHGIADCCGNESVLKL
jgi:hypothetical protein